jgi:hypothetical protein
VAGLKGDGQHRKSYAMNSSEDLVIMMWRAPLRKALSVSAEYIRDAAVVPATVITSLLAANYFEEIACSQVTS